MVPITQNSSDDNQQTKYVGFISIKETKGSFLIVVLGMRKAWEFPTSHIS